MYSWFFQANYMSFTAGGTGQGPQGVTGISGVTGLQGATGYSPYVSGVLIIPAYTIRDVDFFPSGVSKITNYRLHLDNTVYTASSTVDLLETPAGVSHNTDAELGKSSIYNTLSGATGSVTYLQVENRTATDMTVTYLKTFV